MDSIQLAQAKETGRLLTTAVKIIEKLAKNGIADNDPPSLSDEKDLEILQRLVIDARSLTSDRWWEHLK